MCGVSQNIRELLSTQKNDWELAEKNYSDLKNVQVRTFQFDGFSVKVQFNPGRIISSTAKVDAKSIEKRACFLCAANRPKEQRRVVFANYSILVNPFPIFPEHFTIASEVHTPQKICGNFDDMLDLAKEMSGFTLFYNGPKCGASAPDHMHFQAGNTGFMPIDNEIEELKLKYGKRLNAKHVDFWAVQDGLRNFLVLETSDKQAMVSEFDSVIKTIKKKLNTDEEPMMNILTSFDKNMWRVLFFSRALHRPVQYFEEGEKNILLSPASVDLGGVLITPLEKDFKKITKEDIQDIFKQVMLSDLDFKKLTKQL